MDTRAYVKRVWRVPKTRGALEYFATLLTKALVKHAWPADWELVPHTDGFVIKTKGGSADIPPDFMRAVEIATRVLARNYRVDVVQHSNWVGLNRNYAVTDGGHFKEIKDDLSGKD